MADLSITGSSVSLYSGEPLQGQRAGAAFTTGSAVAKGDDGLWYKAQCDGTAAEAGQNGIGIALARAEGAGAICAIAGPGCVVTLGAGLAGVVYCPSATAGNIAPVADMASTNKVTVLGIGIGSNRILVSPIYNAGSVLA